MIVSPFDSLEQVVRQQLGGFNRPVFPALRQMVIWRGGVDLESVRSIDRVSEIVCPTLVVHGDADDVVPMECGRRTFAKLISEKDFETVEGGGHDNVLITEEPVYARMAAWLMGGR